jgi:hypothetical protein
MANPSGVIQEEHHGLAIQPREVDEIDRIDAPFTRLTFRDESLGSMKRPRDLNLGQADVRSRLAQPTKHRLVSRLVNPSNIPH